MCDGLRPRWDGAQEVRCEDAEPFQAEVLTLEARQDRTGTTITLAGEFDTTGTERFWALVSEALAAGPRSITIDASGLEFVDSSGLMALVRARDAVRVRTHRPGCDGKGLAPAPMT